MSGECNGDPRDYFDSISQLPAEEVEEHVEFDDEGDLQAIDDYESREAWRWEGQDGSECSHSAR